MHSLERLSFYSFQPEYNQNLNSSENIARVTSNLKKIDLQFTRIIPPASVKAICKTSSVIHSINSAQASHEWEYDVTDAVKV